MIASFHLVHFKRPVLLPRSLPSVDGLLFWCPFSTGPDFMALKPTFTRLTLAKPDFRRWGFFGVWQEEAALNQFLETSPVVLEWRERRAEAWHVWLQPTLVTSHVGDTWPGVKMLEESVSVESPKTPAVVLTRADLRFSKVPVFWLGTTYPAVNDVRSAPGFIDGIAMTERPFIEVATFTVWQSRDDAINFAYRRRPHQEIVTRNERQRIMKAFSTAHFYPKRSAGTWRGQDPLSVARREPDMIAQNGES